MKDLLPPPGEEWEHAAYAVAGMVLLIIVFGPFWGVQGLHVLRGGRDVRGGAVTVVNVVVLEPNGRHWTMSLAPEKVGEPFERAEPDGPTSYSPRPELPTYTLVRYVGHQIADGNGNRYLVYVRART